MSATERRRARGDLAGDQRGFGSETVESQTTNDATPERFATSGTPHAAGGEAWNDMITTSPASRRWPQFWTAADGGERATEPAEADGGDGSTTSELSGLMLAVFDDDEHWRELARTGRAL